MIDSILPGKSSGKIQMTAVVVPANKSVTPRQIQLPSRIDGHGGLLCFNMAIVVVTVDKTSPGPQKTTLSFPLSQIIIKLPASGEKSRVPPLPLTVNTLRSIIRVPSKACEG